VGASVFPRRDDTAGDFGELVTRSCYICSVSGRRWGKGEEVVGCR